MTAVPASMPSARIGDTGAEIPESAAGVRRRTVRDVLVLAPRGVLDRACLRALDRALTEEPEAPVAIDLTECTLVERSVLERLDPRRWSRTSAQICVVCNRLTGRQLMARTGVIQRFSLFQRIEDALQSRVLAESGYGTGWDHRTA